MLTRLRSRSRLDVVLVEVALEVEVRELLALRDAEELLERGIRLDVVLVLEAVVLHVDVHRLRNLRARHQGAVALAEEVAELIRDLRGALEDRGGTLYLDAVLVDLNAALALASILDLAVDTLLELLHLRDHGRGGLTERGEVGHHGLEVLIKGRGRGNRASSLGGRRRDRRNDNRRSDRRLGLHGLLRDDLLGSRLSNHNNRGRSRNRGRGSRRLRNRLLRDLNRGRGTHYTRSRGIRRRHFTH